MCLSLIQSDGDGYIDQEFYDPLRKEKHLYQSRVYTGPIKLQSAFWPNSINTVNCSIWFQEDLPYPGVDLLKLKPKTADTYPISITPYLRNNEYGHVYNRVLDLNFEKAAQVSYDDRLFLNY